MMSNLTPFTEEEIEQLNELYMCHGINHGMFLVAKFLKEKFGYSNVHNITTEVRKFINKESKQRMDEYHEYWKDSKLDDKLILRINEANE